MQHEIPHHLDSVINAKVIILIVDGRKHKSDFNLCHVVEHKQFLRLRSVSLPIDKRLLRVKQTV